MIAYGSWTGTKRNLAAFRAAGWRLLLSATGHHGPRAVDGWKYALDNGAWTHRNDPGGWSEDDFMRLLVDFGERADWVALPDIVMGGGNSLALSLHWLPVVIKHTSRVLLPVQNGMEPRHVEAVVGPRCGIFIGGDTDWKLSTLQQWCNMGHAAKAWVHVGRVNSERRIRMCLAAGADSFDGTSGTRFAVNTPRLTRALPSLKLFHPKGET